MMTPFIPFLIVTSLHEVFIEGMEYDDIFHISACDLIVWSIYWGDGVRWHLSHLCLWPLCMKYLLRGWSTMTYFTSLLVISLYEVFIERMECDDTFHTFPHCDLTDWSIYWADGVRCDLSYLFSLWPHCMKYLLRGRSTMTPFTPLLIVTLLYEVFIEWMEYDDTFHTFSHCDLFVWSIYWEDGVQWHLSHLCLWSHCMKYLLRGWSTMTSFTSLLVTSLYEVFIERMEYDDIFNISACDLFVWSIYWEDGVQWHLSHLCLWSHCMKYLLRGWSTMTSLTSLLVTSLYEVFIERMEYNDIFHISACDLIVWSIYWEDGVWWHLSYLF
jgi:hypothetical protein